MSYMQCEKCGKRRELKKGESPDDFDYCECGGELKYVKGTGPQDKKSKPGFMASKTFIVTIVFIIAIVGLTAAFLMHMNNYAVTTANNTSTQVNETQNVTYEATWHNVTTLSGTKNELKTFPIKGERFKIVMSATPINNYGANSLKVDINGPSGSSSKIIGSGELNWKAKEAVSTKEVTVELTGTPGTYSATVKTNYIKNWTVTIYDYY